MLTRQFNGRPNARLAAPKLDLPRQDNRLWHGVSVLEAASSNLPHAQYPQKMVR
jgi:hypothetical protein